MQIGSSYPLTVRVNGQNSNAAQQFRTETSGADARQRADADAPRGVPAVSPAYIDAAEKSSRAREEAGFYSMDRNLPYRGQEALNYYLSNAGNDYVNDTSQLVGVDIYV